jgi:hypothetical protein
MIDIEATANHLRQGGDIQATPRIGGAIGDKDSVAQEE